MSNIATVSAKTETSIKSAVEDVKNNWTFTPIKVMNGKWGPCITLLDDVVIEFCHPKTGEVVRAKFKKELNEDYTGTVFSHSEIRCGKKTENKDGELLSSQVRVHNNSLES